MASKKILVADDSLTIQKVIRLALSNEGYEIQTVSDGNDAIQQISVFRPHAVLIDVSLPGKTAFELKRAANTMEDMRSVRFILMSSAFEKVDESQVNEVKFDGRLTKPFDPAHLRQVLSEVLAMEAAQGLPDVMDVGGPAAFTPPPIPPASEEIVLPPPPQDLPQPEPTLDALWDKEPQFTPPPPPAAVGGSEDTDIKQLTESTIRMSGLDDFDWNINEPSLKPAGNISDLGGANVLTPPPAPPKFDHEPLEFEQTKRVQSPSFVPSSTLPSSSGISSGEHRELDEIVRKQVEETLSKMIQNILPDVAERLIKEEIRRLLSEQP